MLLYLLQHGEAVPEAENPDRPLTAIGRADIERLGDFLVASKVRIDRIVHSGKLRAETSAAIIAQKLPNAPQIELHDRLLPGDSPEWLADAVAGWKDDTLVVGHQPFMGRCVSRLILGKEPPVVVDFVPGTIACLARRGATGAWFLSWMMTPGLLRG
jgi:phosphohistidine phosphatase